MKKASNRGPAEASTGVLRVLRNHRRLLSGLFDSGDYAEVEAQSRVLLNQYPEWGFGWKVLGAAHAMRRQYDAAIPAYRTSLALVPGDGETHTNLANALRGAGRLDEAALHYQAALGLMPDDAGVCCQYGSLLQAQGRFLESIELYTRATVLTPDAGDAHYCLANAFNAERRYQEAAEHYRTAITLLPEHAYAHNNLAAVLLVQKQYLPAIRHLSRALELQPDYGAAWNNLGNAFRETGRLEEAVAAFERTLTICPGHVNALPLSLLIKQQLCRNWGDLPTSVSRLREGLRAGDMAGLVPFPLLALPGLDSADHRVAAERFAAGEFGSDLARPPLVARGASRPGRLRVGYLSQDFRVHAVSQLVVAVLERHDRAGFDVTAYSYGRDDGSPIRARIRGGCEHFRDVHALGDEDVARLIAEDGIDILVDLTGFTTDARPAILARRPAPIQVNWLGYPGTLGHARLADYLIGDPCVTPPEHAPAYCETLALLPHCYQPNSPVEVLAPAPSRRAERLPESGVVFCNVNQSAKLTPDVFDIWCRLLREVPDSVLWLLRPQDETATKHLWREAASRGVSPGRVRFAARQPLEQHVARLQLADVSLDSFPYTSHTTASDILRAGVPLVTRIGDTFASRVAASLLLTLGLPELVAESWDQYVQVALHLAHDPDALLALKHKLAIRRQTSPLFDADRFTRDLERLYGRMWADHCAGRKDLILLAPEPSPEVC